MKFAFGVLVGVTAMAVLKNFDITIKLKEHV